ncbi:hypothetical protein BU16DRAFT_221338 [Lophium mytilinum]|uniref:Uncharacterized protein n=1 Tax=Lophium mytilinum TaxID=390894 RepID=A0A6A6QAF6_9PEZI|nr:hypothetical protein BU16DRAFT_221338 [Lophium mytilinum]
MYMATEEAFCSYSSPFHLVFVVEVPQLDSLIFGVLCLLLLPFLEVRIELASGVSCCVVALIEFRCRKTFLDVEAWKTLDCRH